jgi:hypothetical protein
MKETDEQPMKQQHPQTDGKQKKARAQDGGRGGAGQSNVRRRGLLIYRSGGGGQHIALKTTKRQPPARNNQHPQDRDVPRKRAIINGCQIARLDRAQFAPSHRCQGTLTANYVL